MNKVHLCNFAHMKTAIFILLSLPAIAESQNVPKDTITSRMLDEITVTPVNQRTEASKTVYIPDSRQKRAAIGGISLLASMNIPQLQVNPLTETVTTAANQGVSIFINSRPATKEDVSGLAPTDVKRVEYLDFPSDPRFQHAEHVVNFVTNQYEYGGYTKLSAKERFGIRSGEASAYSKLDYGKMEYDLIVNCEYDNNSHVGQNSFEIYKLDNVAVAREQHTSSAKHKQNVFYTGLRASWNKSERFNFRNLLSFHYTRTPVNKISGGVDFNDRFQSSTFHFTNPSDNRAAAWNSQLYADMGCGWSSDFDLVIEYRKNNTSDSYLTGQTEIWNHADEKAWFGSGNLNVNKRFNDKFTAFLSARVGGGKNSINYSGTSEATNKFDQLFGAPFLGVSMNFGKVTGSIDAGFAFESNTINRKRIDDHYPFAHINMQYAPNQKNITGVFFQYASFSPDAAMKNPNVIQQTELLYVGGNPYLTCSRTISANLTYTWLPSNMWQLTAYATFFKIFDRQTAVYEPYPEADAIIKKYYNDGDYNHGQIGTRITGKFFQGKLNASLAPRLLLYNVTGAFKTNYNPLGISLNAEYYLGDFNFGCYWSTPYSYVDGESNFKRRLPSEYSLSAGWSYKGWNISFIAANFLRSSWRMSKDSLNSRWFSSSISQYGPDSHRRFNLSFTYTFHYGKKVGQTNELLKDSNISTSILK